MDYKITVKTGTIKQSGWTEGYAKLDGFLVPAPNFACEDEKIYNSFEEWQDTQNPINCKHQLIERG